MQEFGPFLDSSLQLLADRVLPVTLVLAAIGGASMALWQVAKDLLLLHKCFNIHLLKEWAADGSDANEADATVERLIGLVAAGKKAQEALYTLSTAQLVGQLQAACRLAIADPMQHQEVLKFLVGARNKTLACRFIEYAESEIKQNSAEPAQDTSMLDEERRQRDIALCRDQVEHYVQRKLDALQIRADWKWTWLNRIAAIVLSILITLAAVHMSSEEPPAGSRLGLIAVAIIAGSIAGFIAPVAKDLVKAVRVLRGR